jgi:RimJ/RimL family protein N-acetyltransferase
MEKPPYPTAPSAIGAHRLEAHVAAENGRGNGALRKIGAVRECALRTLSFTKGNTTTSGC